jgi:hypothetical protein
MGVIVASSGSVRPAGALNELLLREPSRAALGPELSAEFPGLSLHG